MGRIPAGLVGLLGAALLLAACSSTSESPVTATTSAEVAAPDVSTQQEVVPNPQPVTDPASVVSSIEAFHDTDRVEYLFKVGWKTTIGSALSAGRGILDNAEQAVSMRFDFSESEFSSSLSQDYSELEDFETILSAERGLLFNLNGEWTGATTFQTSSLLDDLLGVAVLESGLTVPYAGFLLDSILLESAELANFATLEGERRIGDDQLVGASFTVPASHVAGAVVQQRFAIVAAEAPLEGMRVTVEWWTDRDGRLRAFDVDADSIAKVVYTAIADAFPDSGPVGSITTGASIELSVETVEGVPAIVYPAAGEVQMLEGAPEDMVRPGVCFPSTEAALLPVASSRVDCDDPHGAELFALFDVPDAESYPGEDPLFLYGEAFCIERAFTYTDGEPDIIVLHPSESSWDLGDRRVLCLFEFVPPVSRSLRRATIDEVSSFALEPGQCLAPGQELEARFLVLADCGDAHAFEVTAATFSGGWERAFPGDDVIVSEAEEYCLSVHAEIDTTLEFETVWLSPTAETWELGDRIFTCIAEFAEPVVGKLADSPRV